MVWGNSIKLMYTIDVAWRTEGDKKMLEDRVTEELELHVSDPEEPDLDDELILTPSTEEEKSESDELILEADSIFKASEITFDGETESEDRIRKAMEAYDDAMDKAAGMK